MSYTVPLGSDELHPSGPACRTRGVHYIIDEDDLFLYR